MKLEGSAVAADVFGAHDDEVRVREEGEWTRYWTSVEKLKIGPWEGFECCHYGNERDIPKWGWKAFKEQEQEGCTSKGCASTVCVCTVPLVSSRRCTGGRCPFLCRAMSRSRRNDIPPHIVNLLKVHQISVDTPVQVGWAASSLQPRGTAIIPILPRCPSCSL